MTHSAYYQISKTNSHVIDIPGSRLVVKICSESGDPIPHERVIVLCNASPLQSAVLYAEDVPGKPSSASDFGDDKWPKWTKEAHTDDSGIVNIPNVPVQAGAGVFVVLPDILEGWNGDKSAAQQISAWNSDGKPLRFALDAAIPREMSQLDVFQGLNKDDIDCAVDFARHKDANYRGKDSTKHIIQTQISSGSTPTVVKLNQLTEEEKYKHIVEAYAAGGKHMQYAHVKVNKFNDTKNRFEITQGSDCNNHANRFLGFWFNYNTSFQRNSECFAELINRPCTYTNGGYEEYLKAVTSDPEYVKNEVIKDESTGDRWPMQYLRPAKYFAFEDGSLTADGITWAKDELQKFNLYSVGNITWATLKPAMKTALENKLQDGTITKKESGKLEVEQRQIDGREHAVGYVQASNPGVTDSDAWTIIWNLKNTPASDAKLLKKLYKGEDETHPGAEVDWDHHGGILYRKLDPNDPNAVELETFSADSNKINEPRKFSADVTNRRDKFAHYALYQLKTLRPGGFAPLAGAETQAISMQPPRFMRFGEPIVVGKKKSMLESDGHDWATKTPVPWDFQFVFSSSDLSDPRVIVRIRAGAGCQKPPLTHR